MKDRVGVNVNVTVVGNGPIGKLTVFRFERAVFSNIGGKNPSDCRCNTAVRAERKRTVIHVNGTAVGGILQQFIGIITKRTFRNCIDGIADKNQFLTAFDCDFIGMETSLNPILILIELVFGSLDSPPMIIPLIV